MEFQIGQKAKNKITGKTEIIACIAHGYINGYRADLWELTDSTPSATDILPVNILNSICFKTTRWNGKFYGQNIYIDGKKYSVTIEQMEELSLHCQIDY